MQAWDTLAGHYRKQSRFWQIAIGYNHLVAGGCLLHNFVETFRQLGDIDAYG
jgi:hypothetical protein